jgi:hypothetical protein
MSHAEVPITQEHSQEYRWSGEETVEALMQIQGRTIDGLKVGITPDHGHMGNPGDLSYYPPRLLEVVHLALKTSSEPAEQEDILNEKVKDFFDQEGLPGLTNASFYWDKDPLETLGIDIDSEGFDWKPEDTIKLPMVDHRLVLRMSDTVIKNSLHTGEGTHAVRFRPDVYINTTRLRRSNHLYRVDVALGDHVPRSKEFMIAGVTKGVSTAINFREFGAKDQLDALVITRSSQRMLGALLRARSN